MHTIRLRGPWQLEPVFRYVPRADGGYERHGDDLPAAAQADDAGRLGRGVRRQIFSAASATCGLSIAARPAVRTSGCGSSSNRSDREACVVMAEETLGDVSLRADRRSDSTSRIDLRPHNRLEIFVDHPALDEERASVGDPALLPPGGLVGEVRLEIEEG